MRTIAIALIMVTIAAPTVASAENANPVIRHKTVPVSAQDFASAESTERLERKLRSAARAVCTRNRGFEPPSRAEQRCYERAVSNAKQSLAQKQAEHGSALGG